MCVIDFGDHRKQFFPLTELAYNKRYHSGIEITLFDVLYDRRCRSPLVSLRHFRLGRGCNFVERVLGQGRIDS